MDELGIGLMLAGNLRQGIPFDHSVGDKGRVFSRLKEEDHVTAAKLPAGLFEERRLRVGFDPCFQAIPRLHGLSCSLKTLQALEVRGTRIWRGCSFGCCGFRRLFPLLCSVRLNEKLVGEEAGCPENQEA